MSQQDFKSNDPFADPPSETLPYEARQHQPQQRAQQYPPSSPTSYHSSQPTIKLPMNARGDPKNALGVPHDVDGKRDWSHSLFSCFDEPGACCLSCWCPCAMYAKNKSRLHHLNEWNTRHPRGGESLSTDCLLHCGLTAIIGLGWLLQIGTRGATRDRYRIQGGTCQDCITIWACNPCTLTQESREIELEEEFFQGGPGLLLESRGSQV